MPVVIGIKENIYRKSLASSLLTFWPGISVVVEPHREYEALLPKLV